MREITIDMPAWAVEKIKRIAKETGKTIEEIVYLLLSTKVSRAFIPFFLAFF